MKKNKMSSDLLKEIRTGVRLKTKAPRVETPKTVYKRKTKHKRRYDDTSSFILTHA